MKQIESYIKKAAHFVLQSKCFAIITAAISIFTLTSFVVCCLLQHIGIFENNPIWVIVWLFSALSLVAIFSFIMWAAIVIESCCRIDEE